MEKPNPENFNAELKPNGTWHWSEDQDEYIIALEECNKKIKDKNETRT